MVVATSAFQRRGLGAEQADRNVDYCLRDWFSCMRLTPCPCPPRITPGSAGSGVRRGHRSGSLVVTPLSPVARWARGPLALACLTALLPACDCFFGQRPLAAPVAAPQNGAASCSGSGLWPWRARQTPHPAPGDSPRMMGLGQAGLLHGALPLATFVQTAFVKWPAGKRGGTFRGRGNSAFGGRAKAPWGGRGLTAAVKKAAAPIAADKDTLAPPSKGYKLVVVESPAKARTIQKFLDVGMYVVDACMGHVRDLPSSAKEVSPELKPRFGKVLGVDFEDNFRPLYIISPSKTAVIARLIKAQKHASELILATDEDREGEAISWHLLEILKPKIPVKRAVFHEITREAIARAFESPRELDMSLVSAQETRRIMDRLVGFTMSPLLWKKIAPKISAG